MWQSLGSINPVITWQIFPNPTLSRTFRVTYAGDIVNANSFAYLRQYLSNDLVTKSIRLYPKREQEIIELFLPSELQNSGQVVRYLGAMRFPVRRSRRILTVSNWSLLIEEWV